MDDINDFEAVALPVNVCVAYIATECGNPQESLTRNTPHATHDAAQAEAVDIAGTTGRPAYVTKVYVRKTAIEGVIEQAARRRQLLVGPGE